MPCIQLSHEGCARLSPDTDVTWELVHSLQKLFGSIKIVGVLMVVSVVLVARICAQAPVSLPGGPTTPTGAGAKAPGPNSQDRTSAPETEATRIRLGAGDLLEVSVYNVPELATKARVSTTGSIYLPLVDYVHVADLTIEEAQDLIAKRLSDGGFVKDPHVTLFVTEYASQGATVLGEVARPGTYPVLGQKRLFDLISASGGLTEKSGGTVTITHRDGENQPVVLPLTQNLAANSQSNVSILPGDLIVVKRADIVYVVGDVGRPSGFLMNSGGLTVLQAIALAGGTTKTSKLNGARIIRKGAQGMSETDIKLKKMLQAKAPDVSMMADDILFVPSSASKMATTRAIDTAVGLASALTLVAVRP